MAHPGQRNQLRGTEMFTDLRSLSETRGGGAKITLKRQADRSGVTQVSPFNAVQVGIIKQPLAPLDPAAATGQLALVQKHKGRPEVFLVFDMTDPSQIPVLTERMYQQGKAKITLTPCMNLEDLQKGFEELASQIASTEG